ncbi:MAG: MFS transporter, partial [Propionibacteriales bacterium]|nr:MFS transporter [Propionibacteriales bacterium]
MSTGARDGNAMSVRRTAAPAKVTAVGALLLFCYFTAETFPASALPEIAGGLDTSEAAAGSLVSGCAAASALGVLPAMALARRLSPRTALVISAVLLALAQLALSAAPGLTWAVAARVVAALGHGVAFALVPVVAARVAPPGRTGRAMARTFVGVAAGLVGGGPAFGWLAQTVGWRPAAALLGAVALL